MGKKMKFGIFASGRGSNFEAIVQAVRRKQIEGELSYLFCDRSDANVLEIAKEYGVPTIILEKKSGESRENFDQRILSKIKEAPTDYLVLAGYSRILSSSFLDEFKSKDGQSQIINIHPSLLPAFKGLGGYKKAYEQGCHIAGVTVHLVTEGLDDGPILSQEAFSIKNCQSADEVEARGLEIEHRIYPEVLAHFLNGQIKIENRRARVRTN